MRKQDCTIGARVWTKVSGERVECEIIRETTREAFGTRSGSSRRMTKFLVRRIDNGRELPKARSPQSLHVSDGRRGEWPGMTETQDRPHVVAWQTPGVTHWRTSDGRSGSDPIGSIHGRADLHTRFEGSDIEWLREGIARYGLGPEGSK